MQAANATMANIQVNKLRQMYPQTLLYKQSEMDTQHRVPLQLSISPAPLYIKVTLSNQFPQVPPKIHMMSSVTHPSLDPVTIEYVGPNLRNWDPQTSSLAAVVKAIHDEFQANPPMPKQQAAAGQVGPAHQPNTGQITGPYSQQQQVQFEEKQRYSGETVPLAKPTLNDLKKRVFQM